jgi:hypothetical protein
MEFKKKLVSFGLPKVMTKAMTKAVATIWYKKADCTCRR